MPFDYEAYSQKCSTMTVPQLQLEWENYTRQLAGGATSTGASVIFAPVTAGVSLVGLGLSAPKVHNARKKRDIIEKYLVAQGATHATRKRDVALPAAISGTISGLTLGLAGPGADLLGGVAAEKGAEYMASHVILEATGGALEHQHTKVEKEKAFEKRGNTPVPGMVAPGAIVVTETAVETQTIVDGKYNAVPQQVYQPGMMLQPGHVIQHQHMSQTTQVLAVPGSYQEPTYDAVAIPPSYSSAQQSPVPQYQSPHPYVSNPVQPIIAGPSTQPTAPAVSAPIMQQNFQQPEKVLIVVGNPAAGQPFGLEAHQYPPEKTGTYSGPPPLQAVGSNTQADQQVPVTKSSSTPPPWTDDFNQFAPPPTVVVRPVAVLQETQVATTVVEAKPQSPIDDSSLVLQPLFAATTVQQTTQVVVPVPVVVGQPDVSAFEQTRPASVAPQPVFYQNSQQIATSPRPPLSPHPYIVSPIQNLPPPPPSQSEYFTSAAARQTLPYIQNNSVVSAMSAMSIQTNAQPATNMRPLQQYQSQYQPPPPTQQYPGPSTQQYHPTPPPPQQYYYGSPQVQYQPPPSPYQQYQPQTAPQQSYQYQPSTYNPSPAPPSPNPNTYFAPPPGGLHPGSVPQSTNGKPARPMSMFSSLGSSLATSLQNLASSRPSSPNPYQQQQQQPAQTPGAWAGPPPVTSPPPGYESQMQTPSGQFAQQQPQYPVVSPPPAYRTPASGGMVAGAGAGGKDYFSQGQQPQQMGQQHYYGAPPAGQWGQ